MPDRAAWTALTLETPNPVPYGAEIVASTGGERLMRAPNTVGQEHDPSAHAEMRTIRLGSGKLSSCSLRGCTLSTTCGPCPMCMACALWARLDRVVNEVTRRGRGPLCPSNSDSGRGGRKAHPYDLRC